MSREIVESLTAADDRITIAEYIARNTSIDMARKFLKAVEAAYDLLAEMPGVGTSRKYRNPTLSGLRMWPVPRFPNHLIFYIASDSTLEIIRIIHGARDVEEILDPTPDGDK